MPDYVEIAARDVHQRMVGHSWHAKLLIVAKALGLSDDAKGFSVNHPYNVAIARLQQLAAQKDAK